LAYFVNVEDRDQVYLDGLPLSAEAKARLDDFIDYAIAKVEDSFRNDPANRPHPNSHFFRLEFLIRDVWGDGLYHKVTFVVSNDMLPPAFSSSSLWITNRHRRSPSRP
jgi:hypothetical protein